MNDFDDAKVYTQGDVGSISNESADTGIIMGGNTMQKMGTHFSTAIKVQVKRELSVVKDRVFEEVKLAPEKTYYRWMVKTKKKDKNGDIIYKPVEGGTIGLAYSIARNYGNCQIIPVLNETATHFYFVPVFIDMETGFTNQRAFRQRKGQNIGKGFDSERKEDITFQIGQSKGIRNLVLNSVPLALTKLAIKYAKEVALEGLTPGQIENMKEKAIKAFEGIDVTYEMLCKYCGGKKKDKWSGEDITDLRSAWAALDSEEAKVDDFFPELSPKEPKVSGDTDTLKPDAKKGKPAEKDTSEPKKEPEPKKDDVGVKTDALPLEDIIPTAEEEPEPDPVLKFVEPIKETKPVEKKEVETEVTVDDDDPFADI